MRHYRWPDIREEIKPPSSVFLRFKPTDLSDFRRNKSIATLFPSFIDQRIKEREKFNINEETRPRYLRIKMEIVPIDLLSWLIDT